MAGEKVKKSALPSGPKAGFEAGKARKAPKSSPSVKKPAGKKSPPERASKEIDFKLLFESISEMVTVADRGYNIIWANKAAREKLGIGENEKVKCFLAYHHLKKRPPDCASCSAVKSGETVVYEHFEPHLGMHLSIKAMPLLDAEGKVAGAIHIARDITVRRRAEEKLLAANQVLENVFTAGDILIAYLDRDFNFIRVNRNYARADGRPPDFFIGKNHFDLYPDKENEATFEKVLKTGRPHYEYEKAFTYPEHPERGTTYWDWSLHPVKNASGEIEALTFILIDVTESVMAVKALKESRKFLETIVDAAPT